MAKDIMMRKCSHCGHNGHNSRTCNGKGFIKLFGVKIEPVNDDNPIGKIESIRRSKSLGSLQSAPESSASAAAAASGYHSDADERRKGRAWTEEEHRSFLMGLDKLGKGDWRGISKGYVPSRTSTQVASHAQKYFIRKATLERKKRRSSVFDININENADSASPEEPSSNIEPLSIPSSSNQAIIPFSSRVVSSSERPPLSPSMRYNGGFIYPTTPFMIGPASSTRPAFSLVPMMNFPGAISNLVHLPSAYNNVQYAPGARPIMAVPPSSRGVPTPQAEPPPATTTPMTKKDRLDLGIGNLSL